MHNGASAREIWDSLRIGSFVKVLRAEIERMIEGRKYRRMEYDDRPRFEVLRTLLIGARRDAGWTRQAFAWSFGFPHFARLNKAVYRVYGKSVQEVEAEMLHEIANHWHRNRDMCIFLREEPDEETSQRLWPLLRLQVPLRYVIYPPDLKEPAPKPYTLGRPDRLPLLPALPPGRKQMEAVNDRLERVRVFADKLEVERYFRTIGYENDWMREQAPDGSLDEFYDQYVKHGLHVGVHWPYGVKVWSEDD